MTVAETECGDVRLNPLAQWCWERTTGSSSTFCHLRRPRLKLIDAAVIAVPTDLAQARQADAFVQKFHEPSPSLVCANRPLIMLLEFFYPYLSFCHLASWGLAQNLEGLGLFKLLNSEPVQVGDSFVYPLNLNPAVGVANIAVVLTLIVGIVFILNIRACFYLGKWIGCVALALWMAPGILGLLGFVLDVGAIGPDMFRYGSGFPGGMESAAANLLICLVGGWSVVLLLGSRWKKDVFKNGYDHVWYTLGLIAALYFVVDAGLPAYKEDLVDANGRVDRTLRLFLKANDQLEILCASPKAAGLAPDLCMMAPELKLLLIEDLSMTSRVRAKMNPPSWAVKLAADPDLAGEIGALNSWACTQGQRLERCQRIPMDTVLSSSDLDALIVFPAPGYANSIQRLYASMGNSGRRIEEIERGHNLRYFGFLVVAFLAGGKLANASRSMIKVDPGIARSWVLGIVRLIGRTIMALLRGLLAVGRRVYAFISHRLVDVLIRYNQAWAIRTGREK